MQIRNGSGTHYIMAINKIAGETLESNLIRNTDLAFNTDLLYLDVDMKGVLKQEALLLCILPNRISSNLVSDDGSILQKLPFPGSS